jgi:glycosyltransferase involved in cell wall biosynthesis
MSLPAGIGEKSSSLFGYMGAMIPGSSVTLDTFRTASPRCNRMKLLIAIPALNEETNIENIIQRCVQARDEIIAHSPITEVAITVVSDGSTDRTVELARQHTDDIRLIVFEKNRGYGAAIHHAWQGSDADLLAFLDADGTCDPRFFAVLARCLLEGHADVVLGCRLNAETKMPPLRQAGNVLFAALLTLLSGRRICDTASGMRIVRSEAYNRLLPLPSGLHFTPAMSARALLDRKASVKLIEIDMPYHERVGDSKLNAGRDGLRFLGIITKTALIYRPVRLAALLTTGVLTFGVSLFLFSRRGKWPQSKYG